MKSNQRNFWAAFAVLLALLACGSVYAQGAQSVEAPTIDQYKAATGSGDLSVFVMHAIVGGFWDSPLSFAGGASTIMGVLFLVLNSAIFVIGTTWMTYGIVSKVVTTATSGEAFGNAVAGAWLPVRYTIGISGIIPIFGGFSLGQVALVTAAGIGVGVCNFATTKVLEASSNFVAMVHPDLARSGGPANNLRDAAKNIFMYEVCASAVQEQQRNAAAANVPIPAEEILSESPVAVDALGMSAGFGVSFGSRNDQSYCGEVVVGAVKRSGGRSSSSMLGFRSGAVNYDAIAKGAGDMAVRAYSAGFSAFVSDIKAVSVKWRLDRAQYNAKGGALPQVDIAAINAAISKYATAIQAGMDSASAVVKGGEGAISQAAIEKIKDQGWLGLGGWFATFTEANAAIADAVNAVEFRTTDPTMGSGSEEANELSSAMTAYSEAVARASGQSKNGDEGWFSRLSSVCPQFAVNDTGNCSFGQAAIAGAINVAATDSGGTGLVNPIIAVKNVGDWMMTISETYFSFRPVFSGLNWLRAKFTPTSVLAEQLKNQDKQESPSSRASDVSSSWNLEALMMGMFVVGGFMSVVYPLTPFVIWIGAAVQYFVIFFEGVVGMPLGAFSHLDSSDSPGLGQRTEGAWLFILNVTFRPILMVAGFLGGCTLIIGMGTVIAQLFLPAVANAQGNSVTGLASIFLYLFAFYGLNQTLAHLSFNMTYLLPDQVLGLIGRAATEALGRDVHDAHSRVSGQGGFSAGAGLAAGLGTSLGAAGEAVRAKRGDDVSAHLGQEVGDFGKRAAEALSQGDLAGAARWTAERDRAQSALDRLTGASGAGDGI